MILTNIFCANVFINKSALFIRTSVFLVDFQTHSYPTKNKDYLIASTVPRRTFNIHRTFSKFGIMFLIKLFSGRYFLEPKMVLLCFAAKIPLFICKSEVIKHPCDCGRMTKHPFCLFKKTLYIDGLFPLFLGAVLR